mmetsp:Transcript_26159/g.66431  ORF Transcript_26159/g.66431 Transcript_26159/m.66431 type:complete len:283 (+) Transcript_26159:3-851(+)
MLKPVFIASTARQTIREKELLEAQEEAERERKREAAERRKVESKALLIEAVRKEEAGEVDRSVEFAEMPDDDDDIDELGEFDAWKVRELRRVRREREERLAEAREKAELERRRNLTDEERAKEDAEFLAGKAHANEEKAQWKFLQKYYHRGAYFQDEDGKGDNRLGPVMMRDYGHATGKDAIGDKAAMPAPMQVKNFGFKGQVKWTHLSKEDTSGFGKRRHEEGDVTSGTAGSSSSGRPPVDDTPLWAQDRKITERFQLKMGGHKGSNDFDRPSGKRKKPAT